jgi:hypothetical protein
MKRFIRTLLLGFLIMAAAGCTTVTRQASSEDVVYPSGTAAATKSASTDNKESSQPTWFGQFFVMIWAVLAGSQASR